jgi:hypothetical protein
MFEILASGILECAAKEFSRNGVKYGIGGIGREYSQFNHAGFPAGWFAGGGGGAIYNTNNFNSGGLGGGGNSSGNFTVPPAANGAPNTGGGGGGGSNQGWGTFPGNGGSGIVIIRYPLTNPNP